MIGARLLNALGRRRIGVFWLLYWLFDALDQVLDSVLVHVFERIEVLEAPLLGSMSRLLRHGNC